MSTSSESIEPTFAWRSLLISIIIVVIGYVFSFVESNLALTSIELGFYSRVEILFWVYSWVADPIFLGAIYLAIKVRSHWLLNVATYFTVITILALILSSVFLIIYQPSSISFTEVILNSLKTFYWLPIVLLIRLPAVWLSRRFKFLQSNVSESIAFGISTMLWGSVVVALLMVLITWSSGLHKEASAKHSFEYLLQSGALYNKAKDRLTIRPNKYSFSPVQVFDAWNVQYLDNRTTIEFIDCEITDEAIATLKQERSEVGEVLFKNCKVVKEPSPASLVTIGNELNEPLPERLPR